MRAAYQAAIVVCAALALAGCAVDPAANEPMGLTKGAWTIERSTDRVTRKPVSSAFVQTRKIANSDQLLPIQPGDPAMLQLACFKGAPIVRVSFPFKVGSTRTAEFGYSFDEKVGHSPEARIVAGFSTAIIEDPNEVARFAAGLAGAQSAYVRVRSYGAGRSSAEFEVQGAPDALAAAYADCPPGKFDPRAKPKPAARTAAAAQDEDNEDHRLASRERWKSEEEQAFDQLSRIFRR